ncbi:MAG: hypothetical protein KGL54_07220 [Sphingomonadales bacterium]|nr:hypothetical protein [Sphingomonadales bacterium]
MHGVRTRKSRADSKPDEAARQKPAARRKRRAALTETSPAPDVAAAPFLLAPPTGPIAASRPGFPRDITVPPHRGALIVAAPPGPGAPPRDDYLIAPARPAKPRQRTKPAGKGAAAPRVGKSKQGPAKQGQPKPDRAKAGTTAKTARSRPSRSAPTTGAAAVTIQPAAVPLATVPPTTIPLAGIPLAAIPLAERLDHRPLNRDRAMVRQGEGFVARMVAWLGRLMPRQRRTALPRVRTRLTRQDHAAGALAPAMAKPPTPPVADPGPELSRRMLLELSQENERLRREVAALRATLGETTGA